MFLNNNGMSSVLIRIASMSTHNTHLYDKENFSKIPIQICFLEVWEEFLRTEQ